MSVQDVVTALRSEGVSGAGDVQHMLDAGLRQGIADTVAEVLRSEGVSGAADPAHNGLAAALAQAVAIDPAAIAQAVADELPADLAEKFADELGERLKPTPAAGS